MGLGKMDPGSGTSVPGSIAKWVQPLVLPVFFSCEYTGLYLIAFQISSPLLSWDKPRLLLVTACIY